MTATTAQTYRHALVYPCTVTLHPACVRNVPWSLLLAKLYKTHLHAWSMNHVQCAASGEWTHHFCHFVAAQRKSLTCSLLTAFKQVRARGLVSEQYIACLEAQWQGNALEAPGTKRTSLCCRKRSFPDTIKVLARPMSSMRA